MKKNIRIKDIAALAQVSMGTVDRVLHRRGRVSAAAEARVRQVLREIDYQPNLIAKTLSKPRTHRLAVLMPHPDTDPFWHKPQRGTDEAVQQHRAFNVEVAYFFFDPYDRRSFRQQADRALDDKPDGVLLAPVLQQESLPFAQACQQRRIPLVCFNTYIEALPSAAFIGQDLHQSGRVAAQLMALGRAEAGHILILHVAEQAENSVHLYAKEQGFRQYFAERPGLSAQLVTREVPNPAAPHFERQLQEQLRAYTNVSGIFITTAKAYALMPYLGKEMSEGRIIGYDLTEPNLSYLQQGIIDFLIHQEVQKQAFLGISYLVDQLVFKKAIPKIKYLPLGIVTSENVDSYRQAE